MKNSIIFLLLFSSIFINAQQAELIGNTWYLTILNVNGENYEAPNNEEIEGVTMSIDEESSPYFFHSEVCGILGGLLNWVTDTQFSFFDFAGGFECQNSDNQDFELLYAQFYGVGGSDGVPLDYIVHANSDNALILTVTNRFGNTVIYTNSNLSTQETSNSHIKLYPNLVTDKIVICHLGSLENLKIEIYDVKGRLILKREEISGKKEIDLSGLKSGVYFITISSSSNERLMSKRLIKK